MSEHLGWYSGKRVLVSGASGFIGTALCEALAPAAQELRRLGRTDGDLAEPATWRKAVKGVDVIFHLAAQTSVYTAEKDPAADERANIRPMQSLLEACRLEGVRPAVVFAGSSTQVGLPAQTAINESLPDRPVTVYDLHKLIAEQQLEFVSRQGAAYGVTLRLCNVYGPGARSKASDRGVLNAMVRKALGGEDLPVYAPGTQLRDYIFIDDVVAAFLAAGACAKTIAGRHFVLGSGKALSIKDAFELVARRAPARDGKRSRVTLTEPPPNLSPIEKRSVVAEPAAFTAATGWTPRVSLEEGIDKTLEAFTGAIA